MAEHYRHVNRVIMTALVAYKQWYRELRDFPEDEVDELLKDK